MHLGFGHSSSVSVSEYLGRWYILGNGVMGRGGYGCGATGPSRRTDMKQSVTIFRVQENVGSYKDPLPQSAMPGGYSSFPMARDQA